MRIAYLTEWSPYAETGVLRKLIAQVATWRELGHEAQLFSLAVRHDGATALEFTQHGEVFGKLHQRSLERYPFARLGYANKIVTVPALVRALKDYRPDIIYYRQNGPWYPRLGQLLGVAPVVTEINTDERVEIKMWGRGFYALYKTTQSRVLAHIDGFVCVTGEIAEIYRPLGKPVAVIPNSFWGKYTVPLPPSGNTEPAFVFVSSPTDVSSSWHGVDKVLALARALPANAFHIVGTERKHVLDGGIPDNVTMHGEKRSGELSEIYKRCDIGLGTLALHRKKMDEACPLKVREYLMHGLPVVLGYKDTQEELNGADYVLQIGNTPENIEHNIAPIAAFAQRWLNKRVCDDLTFLSRVAIEKKRLGFFADRLACHQGRAAAR